LQLCAAYRQHHSEASAQDFLTHLAVGRLFFDFSFAADPVTHVMVPLAGVEPSAELVAAAGGQVACDATCQPRFLPAVARLLCSGALGLLTRRQFAISANFPHVFPCNALVAFRVAGEWPATFLKSTILPKLPDASSLPPPPENEL
jgi:hypothetical protein